MNKNLEFLEIAIIRRLIDDLGELWVKGRVLVVLSVDEEVLVAGSDRDGLGLGFDFDLLSLGGFGFGLDDTLLRKASLSK